MMTKDIVYYTLFGEEVYYQNLNLSIKSLREIANFEGDILVFSDKKINNSAIINVVLDFAEFKDWFELRFRCNDYFNFRGYSNIIFLDTDVLVVKNLEPLFNSKVGLTCFEQADHYIDTGIINTPFFDFKMFWNNWYKHPINAGQIIFDGVKFAKILDTWKQVHFDFRNKKFFTLNTKYKKTWSDQCSLNYLLRKDMIDFRVVKHGLRLPIVPTHNF
ncbi:MAG: hypothetical protein AAGF07_04300, partial [Patescibacteria group bacterium]